MRKFLLSFILLFVLSGCGAVIYLPTPPEFHYYPAYSYHAPFDPYPTYPMPNYRPDPYGYWRWHHREWKWEPGF